MVSGTDSAECSFAIHVARGLDQLCKRNAKCSPKLQHFLAKQIWSPADRQSILNQLAELFLDFSCTEDICWSFRCIVLEVVYRAERLVLNHTDIPKQHLCIAISKALCICPGLKGLAAEYLDKYGLFMKNPGHCEPASKKRRRDSRTEKTLDLELCTAAWRLSRHAVSFSKTTQMLEYILPYLSKAHRDIRWFAFLTTAEVMGMSPAQKEEIRKNFFSDEESQELTIRHNEVELRGECVAKAMEALCDLQSSQSSEKYTRQSVTADDVGPGVVSVSGILLTRLSPLNPEDKGKDDSGLVMTASTLSNLRNLALAVASSQPVLLQGPVGCGKTSLVEHLAKMTGRARAPRFIKLQLGDQTDSKALLGTYRCTDIPGEFVWQAGVLTQAVLGGHWLLLEDIDYAPMDVLSVLLPLLETHSLSLTGHGDNLHAAPGFQIFFTQRLLHGVLGWHSQSGCNSAVLEKLWRQINVEPLSRAELQQVIVKRFPQLSTVVDRLLDIYFMLSAGEHDLSCDNMDMDDDTETVRKFLSHEGRLISTRDLMTWCRRIAGNFDVKSAESAAMVFQHALDCFCASVSQPEKRTAVAVAIATKLNITKDKAEFYCTKYKPSVEIQPSRFTVGRVGLPRKIEDQVSLTRQSSGSFAFTRQSTVLLERVAVCVANREPVLLVGETGTGKTSSVQFLAHQLGHKLKVINMNQQSDSSDLLGGFKPVDIRHVVRPFKEDFELLFCKTFSRKQNVKFLQHIQDCFIKRRWTDLFTLLEHTLKAALDKSQSDLHLHEKWKETKENLRRLRLQVTQTEKALAFQFIEGTLVSALRQGDWVLLDEINLATAETLECLSGLLESEQGSVMLTERGDTEPVARHEDFRLFACMNPATDVGKKDLPLGIRNRFTELYIDEVVSVPDLTILTAEYLRGLSLTSAQVDGVVKFYLAVRREADKRLTDGTGHRPHFSLRTLCRALRYAAKNPCVQVSRSLYEGFCLSFLTQVNRSSHPIVEQLVCQQILGKANIKSILKHELPEPPGGKHVNIQGYWLPLGKLSPHIPEDYILTQSVCGNLKDLARIVSAGQHPVLIQGETSVGKTSLVRWLAKATGHYCVRVNNHEHTDLQEYIGSYTANEDGKLAFKEGVLVDAMRKGHWIILDELNLAPSDVLEALNRLLDDNRELFIPETQETVRAHPKFMLFATQNPPGHYGGRKMLSRAFRNRFVELHFDEIPSKELETILHKRCDLALSFGRKLVAVMLELQVRRRGSSVFAGKQGFMTLRDLFRWANRYHSNDDVTKGRFYDWDQHMADHGYMLLAGRVRKPEEGALVQEVIQKHLKRTVDPDRLFTLSDKTSLTTAAMLKDLIGQTAEGFEHIVWTYNMRRLAVLVGQAIRYKEPVLLVGDTGCGKTTVCQFLTALQSSRLYAVNCHMHSESADFLGGLRPVRSHERDDKRLFEWVDGPLVLAMTQGRMFLIDEISLADDSVLERLNSVLEPERSLLLAEKGGGDGTGTDVEQISAAEGFQVFATMNPGGDYGKKELSPALRNRFTELWCPQVSGREDLISIIEHNLHTGLQLGNQEDCTTGIGKAMVDFVSWFTRNDFGKRCTVSIRDYLSWVNFMNQCGESPVERDAVVTSARSSHLDSAVAYIHGACLVFLDGLGSGVSSRGSGQALELARQRCMGYLIDQVNKLTGLEFDTASLGLLDKSALPNNSAVQVDQHSFSIPPFSIPKGDACCEGEIHFTLLAPTPCVNGQRVLRALQLPRPLLLEGSPGVGKTSLVTALAKASGRQLVRINLSEQTDVTDLFGADLPVEGAEGGVFAWRDGPLLRALKEGHWVVLDELNLASQSVLEGLNACLDHRAEVYIPELGKTFHIQHEKTRIFACQNPLIQGGGRKGLPRSFLNRFTQVYIEPLSRTDLLFITSTMYPMIPHQLLSQMVEFNCQLDQNVMVEGHWGQRGAPWEFNLRDIFRWCDLLVHDQVPAEFDIGQFVSLLYRDRMRTETDKAKVLQLYQATCSGLPAPYSPGGAVKISPYHVQVNRSFLLRQWNQRPAANQMESPLFLLHHSLAPLESLMKCVEMKWMAILVGPQSSGKTSLVKLLSQLTGANLHILAMNSGMDTTELLGGFEQADIGRHIEDVAKKLETSIREMSTELLLRSSDQVQLSAICNLWSLWGLYVTMATTGLESSSTAELDLMRGQVKQLIILVEALEQPASGSETVRNRLAEIKKELLRLRGNLENPRKKRGGAFEWVDSLLVRALQAGDWLLIDNVNFCSASVLDRLNALLEPNGELSVSERGVIDGQVPIIKPHPNFRLFLAMDPKYGEISRAMRNRGVEICILGEGEGGCYDNLDVKTLLHGIGVTGKIVTDWMIELHEEVKECFIGGERPTIQHLLNLAQLLKQKLDRGVPLLKALKTSCLDIYAHGLKMTSLVKKSLQLVNRKLEALAAEGSDDVGNEVSTEIGLQPNPPVSIQDYSQDCTLANTIKNSTMITYAWDKLQSMCTSRKETPMSNQTMLEIHETLGVLKHGAKLFIEQLSLSSWQLALSCLKSFFQKRERLHKDLQLWLSKNDISSSEFMMLASEVMESLQKEVVTMFTCSVAKDWEAFLMKFSKECQQILRNESCDPRWNPQCLIMVLRQVCRDHGVDFTTELRQNIESLQNRLHLVQLLTRQKAVEDFWISNLSPMDKSPLGLSVMFHQGSKGWTSLEHPSLPHLYPLVTLMHTYLQSALPAISDLSDEKLEQIEQGFCWFLRLLDLCKIPAPSGVKGVLPQLHLHWNWFYSKTLPVLWESCPNQPSAQLQTVLRSLDSHLGQDSRRSRLFLTLWRKYGHPEPCGSEREAELRLFLQDICSVLLKSSSRPQEVKCSKENINMATRMFVAAFRKLLQKDIFAYDSVEKEVEKSQALLSGLLESLDQPMVTEERSGLTAPPVGEICPANEMKNRSEPVFDLVVVLTQQYLCWKALEDGHSVEGIAEFTDFCLQHGKPNPELLSLLEQIQLGENKDKWPLILSYLLICHDAVWKGTLGNEIDPAHQQDSHTGITIKGPGILQLSPLTTFTFRLLRPDHHQGKISDNIPLRQFQESRQTLQDVQQLLWLHCAVLSSPVLDFLNVERRKAVLLFWRLLESLSSLLSAEKACAWRSLLQAFKMAESHKLCKIADGLREIIETSLCSSLEDTVTDILLKSLEHICGLFCSTDMPPVITLGAAWTHVGLLQSLLLTPVGPVDPVVKQKIKLQYTEQELSEIESELSVRDLNQWVTTGTKLDESRHDLLHPRVLALFKRRKLLLVQHAELEKEKAYRPECAQFDSLIQDVTNYQGTMGEPTAILRLLEKLVSVAEDQSIHFTQAQLRCFHEEQMWQSSLQKFLDSILLKYPNYRDLFEPFLLGIHQMKHGMRMVSQFASVHHQRALWFAALPANLQLPKLTWLEDFLQTLGKFPSISRQTPRLISLVENLSSHSLLQMVKIIAEEGHSGTDSTVVSRGLVSKILLSALQILKQHTLSCATLSSEVLSSLNHLVGVFVTLWGEQEASRRLKEEEDSSLYRYKSTNYGEELTDDELNEQDFQKAFPLYEQEFLDVLDKPTLDDGPMAVSKDAHSSKEEFSAFGISEQEMAEVWHTHQAILTYLTQSDWLKEQQMTTPETHDLQPFLSCYQTAAVIGHKAVERMYHGMDKELVGSHLAMITSIHQSIRTSSLQEKELNEKLNKTGIPYDIYHDSNMAEVVKCHPLLERFLARVKELQMDWPDHPTLKQLSTIVHRILGFPVTCPLMKFLTGLELLVQKAQDWESNAASFVSMATQMREVTDMIIEWRKLELRCWNNSLETVLMKACEKAHKWWFYLYQLVESVLSDEQQSVSSEEKKTDKEIVSALTQFLESSPLGEFKIRLEMVYGFHCQLVHKEPSEKQEWLLNVLWNLHQFYQQFLTAVTDELTRQRTPIEKELKGFVKIARWNDINYWALKQTTEKTHRTIHKHMKAFQVVLAQPVKSLLVETQSNLNILRNPVNENWSNSVETFKAEIEQKWKNQRHLQIPPHDDLPVLDGLPLQSRAGTLCRRMNNHCSKITSSAEYPQDVNSLDEYTGLVIEAIEDLQALEVNKEVDKEKQKSEAKSINLRKRKALSDLFRSLTELGLSYRKGLTLNTEELQTACLLVPPVDVGVLTEKLNGGSRGLTRLWEGCSHYYYRCVSRRAQLLLALEAPSQELGARNVDRCRGFTEQMMDILIEKQREMAHLAGAYSNLMKLTDVLSHLNGQLSTNDSLPPQDDCQAWFDETKKLLLTVMEGLQQFRTVLQCCPEVTSSTEVCMSPLKQSSLPLVAGMKLGDEKWREMVDCIEGLQDKAKKSYSVIRRLDGKRLYVWSDVSTLSQEMSGLRDAVPKMETVAKQFNDPSSGCASCLNEVLYYLCDEVSGRYDKFKDWEKVLSSVTQVDVLGTSGTKVQGFAESTESLLATMLLAIQNVLKRVSGEPKDIQTESNTGEDTGTLKDKHLTIVLHCHLKEDLAALNYQKVSAELSGLVDQIQAMYSARCASPQPAVPTIQHGLQRLTPQHCLQRLIQCLPLLQQYSTLVEFYLAQAVSAHRVTGKLLSVLLKVFTELALKGFCLPAEFAGEVEGAGATEFEDIEGGGIGEGEGTKDVSDQVETEDQLHEAQKAGEKKEEEASDQPDVPSEDNAIEMSDDFEGKMHDLDPDEGEEDEDGGNNEEEKLDKQLGDVDGEGADRLDEQMWGSDNEEEEEEAQDKESKEETGPGAGKQSESELVAKDDLPDKSEREGEMEPQPEEEEEREEQKPHDLDKLDESEYDDNQVDPNNKLPPEEQPDALELPDDLNLDEGEGQEMNEEEQALEHEIGEEQNTQDLPEDMNEDKPGDSEDKTEEDKGDNLEDKESEDLTQEPEEGMDIEQSVDTPQAAEKDMSDDPESNEEGKHEEGLDPQDNPEEEVPHKDSLQSEEAEMSEVQGQTSHGVEETEQSETAKDRAGTSENNQDESDGTGQSISQISEGHEGQSSTQISQGGYRQENKQKKKHKPGVSHSERSLGSVEKKYKRLTTQDNTSEQAKESEDSQKEGSDLFEHIKDSEAHSDLQTLDVATSDQQEEQPIPNKDMEEAEPVEEEEVESIRPDDRQDEDKDQDAVKELKPGKLKPPKTEEGESKGEDSGEAQQYVSSGERVLTMTAERGLDSTIHTALEHLNIEEENVDVEKLRSELEDRLPAWHQTQALNASSEAMEAWVRYEAITSTLSQELCEQLRLVLEPTQATKLKGDYRTGKRLNMRKVIPYIASEFRKDKIWLRRTKPSKRKYQILVAIDDSSSMMDNHSKQLAFESLAVISNALSLLEAGQLGICSFGESVQVLHPFTEQFTSQSGARILQQFTFEQKKTKIAQLLKEVTGVMLDARAKHPGAASRSETAQLLLVVSDGRGLFMEGMDVVKTAVRKARAANIFLVFVVIDNPQCKDSILDIKVPHFKGPGQLPEIQSYMDHFPFPFYLILRDINSLPSTLSDALRQWFELVTACDR